MKGILRLLWLRFKEGSEAITTKYGFLKIWSYSLADIQKSDSLKYIVEDVKRLKQQLEYFERHVQSKNQEVKKEYFRALSQVLKAEEAIQLFADVFYR